MYMTPSMTTVAMNGRPVRSRTATPVGVIVVWLQTVWSPRHQAPPGCWIAPGAAADCRMVMFPVSVLGYCRLTNPDPSEGSPGGTMKREVPIDPAPVVSKL